MRDVGNMDEGGPEIPRVPVSRKPELETLLQDVAGAGDSFRRLGVIIVEWPTDRVDGDGPFILGPRGYCHPYMEHDATFGEGHQSVRGLIQYADNIERPEGRRAYLLVFDRDDDGSHERNPEGLGLIRVRPDLDPLMRFLGRAGAILIEARGSKVGPEGPLLEWFFALAEFTEPDERFTWGSDAGRLHGTTVTDSDAVIAHVPRDHDPSLRTCAHIRDVVHASKVLLRRLIASMSQEAVQAATVDQNDANLWQRGADFWTLRYEGNTLPPVKHLMGLEDLRTLIQHQGKPISAADLSGEKDRVDAREKRDSLAIRSLHRALEDAEALPGGETSERAAQLRAELRRQKRRPEEKRASQARSRTTKRIGDAIEAIRKHDPALARHLNMNVKRGKHCIYAPEPPAVWLVPDPG